MKEARNILIGFDFGTDGSQICYYDRTTGTAMSLPVKAGTNEYTFSNCLSTKDGENWHFGPEAEYFSAQHGENFIDGIYNICMQTKETRIGQQVMRPGELLAILIRESLQLLGIRDCSQKISSFMLTTPRISKILVDNVREAYEILGFSPDRCYLQDYAESFFFASFLETNDRRGRKCGLFVFEDQEVYFRKLNINQTTRPVMVQCQDGKRFTLSGDDQKKDMEFYNIIITSLGSDVYSTLYLIGDGFSQEWAVKSVPLLCKGQRRVFVGNNLYAKGACHAASERIENRLLKSYMYIGQDVVRYHVGMELLINGVPGYYPLIGGGENWYDSANSCELLLDHEDTIRLQIGEMNSKEKKTIAMKLDGIPKRPPKASRVRVEVGFTSATSMKIRVTDLGFGDIYPSSHKIWEETLNEQGDDRV